MTVVLLYEQSDMKPHIRYLVTSLGNSTAEVKLPLVFGVLDDISGTGRQSVFHEGVETFILQSRKLH
jgi:predicted component of type VI protein secretion system